MGPFRKSKEAIERLTPEQYRVTQQNGTETPGTGEYLDNKQPGIYVDIVSGEPLFASSDKFESAADIAQFQKQHLNPLVLPQKPWVSTDLLTR